VQRLGRTMANLARFRRHWEESLKDESPGAERGHAELASRLTEVTGFGSNPGNLRMFKHVPERLPPSPALVVILHGCTQSAAAYDHGAGWSTLAERYGFVLLAPEQQQANNPKTCFTWFQPGDTQRGQGEALSIRQMVDRMAADHGVDRSRIFVTGLSAGGAMTSVMLATYPDVFAGGAIIAGLPYGCASNVKEAFESMFQGRTRPAREWGDLVRAASPHRGPWPRVSVWHGSADLTVVPMNAQEVVKQWTNVHGLSLRVSGEDRVDGYPRRIWRGRDGEVLVEEYTITGMAHGTPLALSGAEVPHGAAGPFLLDVGIASSYHIAKFWGITGAAMPASEVREANGAPVLLGEPPRRPRPELVDVSADERRQPRGGDGRKAPPIDIQGVITKALKAAGLLRP
jgi:poly(hydroxyalkanoate) depolymerase family esterase